MKIPAKLLQSLQQVTGFDEKAFIDAHASKQDNTSIRLNPFKPVAPEALPASEAPVPWSQYGYYLPQRPSFTMDPLFHAGCYYVQEASSMFLEEAVRQTTDLSKPLRVLDLCAAPGGKTTLLQSLISNDSLLLSNETIRPRVSVLIENVVKWGAANTIITNNDPKDFSGLEDYFDLLVVDAPCSGSGLFRRDPAAIDEWSENNVQLCSMRQQRILADAWPALKQNGILIYSTCSYSKEENEDILDWLMEDQSATGIRLRMDPAWGVIESFSFKNKFPGYRFYPDKLKGEGLFMAVIRKNDGGDAVHQKFKKTGLLPVPNNEKKLASEWLNPNFPVHFFKHNEVIHVLPHSLAEACSFMQSRLYLKKVGVAVGTPKQGGLVPSHELAFSNIMANAAGSVDLSKEEAIQYLRKDKMNISSSQTGWVLAKYQGRHLGWMKILKNRINNYYPLEWRILKK